MVCKTMKLLKWLLGIRDSGDSVAEQCGESKEGKVDEWRGCGALGFGSDVHAESGVWWSSSRFQCEFGD